MMYCCSTGISGKTAVRTTRMNTHTHTHNLRNSSRRKKKKQEAGSDPELKEVKVRPDKLEEAVKEIVVETRNNLLVAQLKSRKMVVRKRILQ